MDPSSQHTTTKAPAALSTEPAACPNAPTAYSLDPTTYPTGPAAYPANPAAYPADAAVHPANPTAYPADAAVHPANAAAYSADPAAYSTAPAPPYVYNPYADQHNANFPQKQMQIQKQMQMQMRMQMQMPTPSGGDYHPGHTGRTGLVDAEVIQGDEAAIPQGQRVARRTVIVKRDNTRRWVYLGVFLFIKVIIIIFVVIHFTH